MTRVNTLDPSKSISPGYTTGGITDTESACLPVGRDTDTLLSYCNSDTGLQTLDPRLFFIRN
jgi:hypothetical protein